MMSLKEIKQKFGYYRKKASSKILKPDEVLSLVFQIKKIEEQLDCYIAVADLTQSTILKNYKIGYIQLERYILSKNPI